MMRLSGENSVYNGNGRVVNKPRLQASRTRHYSGKPSVSLAKEELHVWKKLSNEVLISNHVV